MRTTVLLSLAFIVALLVFGVSQSHAQAAGNNHKPLTNADVVNMVAAGMSETGIILAIQGAVTDFQIGASDLALLKRQGASDRILAAMIDSRSGGTGGGRESRQALDTSGADRTQGQVLDLGVQVSNLTSEIAQRLGVPQQGVLVVAVKTGSFADEIGLSRGDVIVEVNKVQVHTEEEFRYRLSLFARNDDVVFLVRPRGVKGTVFMAGTVPKATQYADSVTPNFNNGEMPEPAPDDNSMQEFLEKFFADRNSATPKNGTNGSPGALDQFHGENQPRPPSSPSVPSVESLPDAVANGHINVEIRSNGGSSGDVIYLTASKSSRVGNKVLTVTIPVGTRLNNTTGTGQSMVVSAVRGRMTGQNMYEPSSEVRLADDQSVTYVLDAYCAEFHKANPAVTSHFEIGPPNPTITCILETSRQRGLSINATQAAVWIVTDHVSLRGVNEKFPVSPSDWGAASGVVQSCGR